MTGDPPSLRILAVDDLEPIRTVIARVLTGAGYRVDVAASLAEARGMNPAGYDVILVDAFLGQERGTDLINDMIAADPAASGRCLLVTGSVGAEAPPGVALLEKPFDPAGLIAAVRALQHPDAAGLARPGPPSAAAPGPASAPRPGTGAGLGPGPGVGAPAGPRSQAPRAAPWPLLALVWRARAAERTVIADFVHDGPIQNLTSAMLSLGAASRGPDGQQARLLGTLREQLEEAARSLRQLMEAGSDGPGGMDLASILRRRAAWLPFAPVTVEVHPSAAAGSPGRAILTAELVELILFALADHFPGPGARVMIRAGDDAVEVQVWLSPAGDTPAGPADRAGEVPPLTELARALGGTAHTATRGTGWHARVTVPGR